MVWSQFDDSINKLFYNEYFCNKLLILSSGDYSVRFRPHLTVTTEEIDIAIDTLYKSIKEILN